jgi:GNAT superfamily N-acetyltransferase
MGNILMMDNTHPDFYPVLGPFLARRSIAKELMGPIYDDDRKRWFVIRNDEGAVMAFASMLTQKNKKIVFCEAYVLPEYRNQGLHARLIDERMAHCPAGSTIKVLVCAASIHSYEQRHFQVKRVLGKDFSEMIKVMEEA